MAAALLVLILPAFSGCFGGGDGAVDSRSADAAADVPTLPSGLEMEGAEVVSYNETSVLWRWTAELPPGASATSLGVDGPSVETRFDIPPDVRIGFMGRLTWEAETLPQLILEVDDAQGSRLCRTVSTLAPEESIACGASLQAGDAPGPATVRVMAATNLNERLPITLELALSTGPLDAAPAQPLDGDFTASGPHVVMAFTDTGINPYHAEFRDDRPEAYLHPSTYIERFPADVPALELTLDAPTMADAFGADADVWASVEPGTLYWVPGTRIVGVIMPDATVLDDYANLYCETHVVLDCNGHGTSVAARGAGTTLGTCPECRIVAVQGLEGGLAWATEQPWIDVTSNSWWHDVTWFDREEAQQMMSKKPSFIISTNGVYNAAIAGTPSTVWPYQSAPDAIVVGGHDNGRITAWPGSVPRIVSDACVEYAVHTSLSDSSWVCATSLSTPGAAGTGARVLLETRRILDDAAGGVHDDILARGNASGIDSGPLADGELTNAEYRRLLYATADPRPRGDPESPTCDPTSGHPICLLAPTLPVEWQTIPDDVPAYYFIGYGAVNEDTLEHAKRVLRGEEPMPERPVEDAFFALDQEVRKALLEVDP